MLAYRIVYKSYSGSLYAPGLPGRWNSAGNKVLYAADSIPLAFLENLVRKQGVGFNHDYQIMFMNIEEPFSIKIISQNHLKKGWRSPYDYSKCQPLGDAWFDAAQELILKVPSAVMPEAFNFVINTQHPDFPKVELASVTNLIPDDRIEDILKKYKAN